MLPAITVSIRGNLCNGPSSRPVSRLGRIPYKPSAPPVLSLYVFMCRIGNACALCNKMFKYPYPMRYSCIFFFYFFFLFVVVSMIMAKWVFDTFRNAFGRRAHMRQPFATAANVIYQLLSHTRPAPAPTPTPAQRIQFDTQSQWQLLVPMSGNKRRQQQRVSPYNNSHK